MVARSPRTSVEGPLPSVRLREVNASDLAGYPDGGAEPEAD